MHIYEENGILLPSVTTILHSFIINDGRLLKWSNRLGWQHKSYDEELQKSATFGTALHSLLEQYMNPNSESAPVQINGFDTIRLKNAFSNFVNYSKIHELNPENTLYTEMTLKSTDLGFAGTCDWIGSYKNKLTLIDYKSSSKPNDIMFYQLAAYDKLISTTLGLKLENWMILTVNGKGVKEYPITRDDIDKYYEIFMHFFEIYKLITPYSALEEAYKQLDNNFTEKGSD